MPAIITFDNNRNISGYQEIYIDSFEELEQDIDEKVLSPGSIAYDVKGNMWMLNSSKEWVKYITVSSSD